MAFISLDEKFETQAYVKTTTNYGIRRPDLVVESFDDVFAFIQDGVPSSWEEICEH